MSTSEDSPDHARPPAVSCAGLRKAYGGTQAVDGVDLQVADGEVLALLGPSGCGKTTLIRLIAGFERPDAGEVFLRGRLVARPGHFVPPEDRRVGVVFQDHALFPHLTVAANVGYGLRRSERRDGRRVTQLLELVGLADAATRHPHELSGGEQQRVALARALAPRPAVVLLDEPFSNLDAELRDRVRREVRDILRVESASALFVTHDQEEALSLADRVAVMFAGRVVQVDTPVALYTRPASPLVAAFVGGANLVPGHGDGRTVQTAFGPIVPGDRHAAGPVTVMIRPESIHVVPSEDGGARVASSVYHGRDRILEVVSPTGASIRVRLGPGTPIEAGTPVALSVVADDVLVYPVSEGSGDASASSA